MDFSAQHWRPITSFRLLGKLTLPLLYLVLSGTAVFIFVHRHIVQPRSCIDYALSIDEPWSARYAPRGLPTNANNEPAPAFWRWHGVSATDEHATLAYNLTINKDDFDAAASVHRLGCPHCLSVVHYRIVAGRLYADAGAKRFEHRDIAEEMLKIILYLFPDMPDMEFLLHFGDGCAAGLPVISWNVCRDHPDAGFTMPSYSVWRQALGPKQMEAHAACIRQRYPITGRVRKVVWRGSTTDTALGSFTKDNYLQALRVQLHIFARNHSDVLDVKLATLLNCDTEVRAHLADTGDKLAFEDYNRYCAILDVDGNGWSDRFAHLLNWNTPILKLASRHTAYFEHLYAPGQAVDTFTHNFSTLVDQAARLLEDCQEQPGSHASQLVAHMNNLTRTHMDQVGILEAFAYTLMRYHNMTQNATFNTYAAELGQKRFVPVSRQCCRFARVPWRLARLVKLGQAGA